MIKIKGNHSKLHLAVGDQVQIDNGPIGTVTSVQPKFSEDGIYGKVATYRVRTDDGTQVWIPDYKVTGVIYQ